MAFTDRQRGIGRKQPIVGTNRSLFQQQLSCCPFDLIGALHSARQHGVVRLNHVHTDFSKNGNVHQNAGARLSVLIPIKYGWVAGLVRYLAVGRRTIVAYILLSEVGVIAPCVRGSLFDFNGIALHWKVIDKRFWKYGSRDRAAGSRVHNARFLLLHQLTVLFPNGCEQMRGGFDVCVADDRNASVGRRSDAEVPIAHQVWRF